MAMMIAIPNLRTLHTPPLGAFEELHDKVHRHHKEDSTDQDAIGKGNMRHINWSSSSSHQRIPETILEVVGRIIPVLAAGWLYLQTMSMGRVGGFQMDLARHEWSVLDHNMLEGLLVSYLVAKSKNRHVLCIVYFLEGVGSI